VICAEDDILTPIAFSEDFARLIPGARLHRLKTGGHACSRTVPDDFESVVLDFLRG
jgi:aminoacrylate hydrolase